MIGSFTPTSAATPGDARTAHLGRYQLLTPIASGGMAEVFVARARGEGGFQRLVAIKRILPELADDPSFVDMFLDEGRLAGLVASPHVVQVLDVARTEDGTLFMVLELVRGVALHQLLRHSLALGERLPVPVLVGILAQAAEGLAAAHEATTPAGDRMSIVHRDVSPQNILVGIDGRAKLADFGIARAMHRRTATATGELRGKLGYFAPEQILGKVATARSDVFALSVVAWEALAGQRLFKAADAFTTLRDIRKKEAPLLHSLRADVPPALAAAIARGLAKSPEQRTGTARELAADLRAAVPEASAADIASCVGPLIREEVGALDARIRAALDGADTAPRLALPVAAARSSATAPTRSDEFVVDSDTTTQLVTPSSELEQQPSERTAEVRPRAAASRRLWMAGLLVAAVIGATLGVWLAVDTSDPPADHRAATPTAPDPGDSPPSEPPPTASTTDPPASSSAGEAAAPTTPPEVPSPPSPARDAGRRRPPRPPVDPPRPTPGGLQSVEEYQRSVQRERARAPAP